MKDQILRLSKDTLIYGVGNVAQRFLAIFLAPIFTRIFSPADYGILDVITTAVALLQLFLILGLDAASSYYYFHTEGEKEKRQVLSTALTFLAGFALLVAVVAVFAASSISLFFFGTQNYSNHITIALFSVPFVVITAFLIDVLRLRFQAKKYVVMATTRVLLTAALSIYLIAFLHFGVIGAFWANLVTGLVTTLLGFYLVRDVFELSFSVPFLKKLLRYGLPLVPAALFYWVFTLSDRFLLTKLVSLNEVGVYTIGAKLAAVMAMLVGAFQLAWGPFALSVAKRKEAKEIYANVLTVYLAVAFFFSILVASFAKEILIIFTTAPYFEASKVVGLLSIGAVFYGAYYIVAIGVNLAKKTEHLAWTTGLAALVSIGLNLLIIPRFGMLGAAFVNSLAFLTSALAIFFVSQKYYPINFQYQKVLIILFFGVCLTLIGSFLSTGEVSLEVIFLKALVVFSFPVLLFSTRTFTTSGLRSFASQFPIINKL